MKVLVLNGSPKGEKSNSLKLTRAFVSGLSEVCSIEVEEMEVCKLNIKPCTGCLFCWKRTPGRCVAQDDMGAAIEKVVAADLVIWSFPLYYYSLPGQLKLFLDKQVPSRTPLMRDRTDGKGNGVHSSRYDLSHQRDVLISTCGFFSYKGNYDSVKAQFDLMKGVDNYTSIFCGQGEMFPVPILKERTDKYLENVKQAGREYGQYDTILNGTRAKLDELIMPKEEFEQMADSYYAHCMAKAKAKAEAEAAADV